MPSLQVVDLSPRPRTEETSLEKTVGAFSKRYRENQLEQQETDALKDIYGKYQQDGQNLENAIMAIQTRPGLSPTTRVNSVKQLMEFQKHNGELQKQAKLESEKAEKKISEANKETRMQEERDTKKANEAVIAADLVKQRNMSPEQAAAYAANPSVLDRVYPKQSKGNQADRPIDPEQQKNIDKVKNSPEWKKATISQKQDLLSRGNVSAPNQKAILDPLAEELKTDAEKQKYEREFAYKVHKDTVKYDDQIEKEAKAAQNQLDAIEGVEKSIKNVKPYSLANIFKHFGEVGKSLSNALLTKDEARIQASVPAFLEGRKELFGVRLSDADLRLLQDKLPDISKSEASNREILKMMKKYSKLALVRKDVANKIKSQNKGMRPIDYSQRVEETFDQMKKPVKIINPNNGRVISIPAFELEEALQDGATLYNE